MSVIPSLCLEPSSPEICGRCVVAAANATKSTDCYLGLLYVEDVAVYGYMTPLKVKIIIALELSDAVVRDADVIAVRVALPTACLIPDTSPRRYLGHCTQHTAVPLPIHS